MWQTSRKWTRHSELSGRNERRIHNSIISRSPSHCSRIPARFWNSRFVGAGRPHSSGFASDQRIPAQRTRGRAAGRRKSSLAGQIPLSNILSRKVRWSSDPAHTPHFASARSLEALGRGVVGLRMSIFTRDRTLRSKGRICNVLASRRMLGVRHFLTTAP